MFKVKFADIGEGLTEGKVAEVLVKLGQEIKEGDALFFVETDKVNSEIPAPVGGKIANILISQGQEIKVGDVVIEIDDGKGVAEVTPVAEIKTKNEPVEENASVVGSTPVSNDVIASRATASTKNEISNSGVKATPLARKVAADKKIDLSTIKGTGPHGRILVSDLDSTPVVSSNSATKPAASKTVEIDAPLSWDSIPMNGIRKATVKAMVKSHSENAAFTGMKNINITPTYEMRAMLKDGCESKGIKLTYLAFIVKAAAKVLEEMPNINVRIDTENNAILQVHNINIGIAVDTEKGLMVPVIKGANHLTIFEIANKIGELAKKARDGKLAMTEMKDATFTVSNFGSVGLDYATPIINSPESAILGVGTMTKTPVFVKDEIKAGWIMPFSMTCDHRIIDGGDAGRFLMKVENYLSNPALLLM
ncbi:branched-chain alpha-keto acid dehydrogenase subunit E2 [Mesoplasma chauliocola]|uniref:Dihydrolipoamide acetyltransferase component of pyruvate dehydrogenase complex n=1 Tax=Mesoplasma chauliocola TaxID=216427 RepID=A0A249SMA9_9MOLU|nr:dihydrolipoamide acetyltransferase family protein [Mesoplasma chauliocola]ASZ08805.1 branched-chain alpha-keto acid dehydrogenase subunit E2 [Mesoplasma chauliocola]